MCWEIGIGDYLGFIIYDKVVIGWQLPCMDYWYGLWACLLQGPNGKQLNSSVELMTYCAEGHRGDTSIVMLQNSFIHKCTNVGVGILPSTGNKRHISERDTVRGFQHQNNLKLWNTVSGQVCQFLADKIWAQQCLSYQKDIEKQLDPWGKNNQNIGHRGIVRRPIWKLWPFPLQLLFFFKWMMKIF